jgi:hypothetical protein
MSRFDTAVQTRRRIVLYGNILDWVHDASERLVFIEWLRRQLGQHGIERVVLYNFCEEPRVLSWEESDLATAQRVLIERLTEYVPGTRGQPDPTSPSLALRFLGNLLHEGQRRTAVILENSEHRISEPSLEAVLIRQLVRENADRTPAQGLVVHLYTSESQIPRDFFASDADTALILVVGPSFSDRLSFFRQSEERTGLRVAQDRGAPITLERLARITEGYRLRELDQLQILAQAEEPGVDIGALLSLFRHGRKIDPWAMLDVAEVRKLLDDRVKGQDGAIDQVVRSVSIAKHNVASLIDEAVRTPAMVLFFVGATGVGKTLMARTICEAITGTEENLKRIDMSEYQREHTDQRLIGPPPGYVGHLEGGQLTNWVLERPHSVILFDEIEKAHERIFDIFLQMLDGARLTDGKGLTVDMSQTILIFTSNIGVAETMGRTLEKDDRAAVETHYLTEVERFFNEDLERPEIFNRLKRGVVVFDYIAEDIARPVIEARLKQIAAGMTQRSDGRLRIRFEPKDKQDKRVVDELLKQTRCSDFGLRDVNNVLFRKVAYVVAELLDNTLKHTHAEWRFRWNEVDGEVELTPLQER